MPLIEHLLKVERQSGRTPQMLLDAPACPPGCEELWRIFGELHSCRGNNGFGPSRISYSDLDAYQRVNAIALKPWEIEALKRADTAYLNDWQARQPKRDD